MWRKQGKPPARTRKRLLADRVNFHDLTTQDPYEVWMAIGRGAHRPRMESPPLRIHYFSGPALTEGVEEHRIEGVTAPVYNVAKTVADCFKYRNKIGLDVALEALRMGNVYSAIVGASSRSLADSPRATQFLDSLQFPKPSREEKLALAKTPLPPLPKWRKFIGPDDASHSPEHQ